MSPLRILVTGSRDWPRDRAVEVRDRIAEAAAGHDPAEVVIVHGGARGADAWADLTATRLGFQTEVHRADWNRLGRAAGMLRNREMVQAGADVCLAFPLGESRGTRGCIREAQRAAIPVHTFGGDQHQHEQGERQDRRGSQRPVGDGQARQARRGGFGCRVVTMPAPRAPDHDDLSAGEQPAPKLTEPAPTVTPGPGRVPVLDVPVIDVREARPGWMRANFWSQCRACDQPIHGPGTTGAPCPCGTRHPRGEVQALADVPGHGMRWVHGDCADDLERRAQQHDQVLEHEHEEPEPEQDEPELVDEEVR